jgi:hypothetical protein
MMRNIKVIWVDYLFYSALYLSLHTSIKEPAVKATTLRVARTVSIFFELELLNISPSIRLLISFSKFK